VRSQKWAPEKSNRKDLLVHPRNSCECRFQCIVFFGARPPLFCVRVTLIKIPRVLTCGTLGKYNKWFGFAAVNENNGAPSSKSSGQPSLRVLCTVAHPCHFTQIPANFELAQQVGIRGPLKEASWCVSERDIRGGSTGSCLSSFSRAVSVLRRRGNRLVFRDKLRTGMSASQRMFQFEKLVYGGRDRPCPRFAIHQPVCRSRADDSGMSHTPRGSGK